MARPAPGGCGLGEWGQNRPFDGFPFERLGNPSYWVQPPRSSSKPHKAQVSRRPMGRGQPPLRFHDAASRFLCSPAVINAGTPDEAKNSCRGSVILQWRLQDATAPLAAAAGQEFRHNMRGTQAARQRLAPPPSAAIQTPAVQMCISAVNSLGRPRRGVRDGGAHTRFRARSRVGDTGR